MLVDKSVEIELQMARVATTVPIVDPDLQIAKRIDALRRVFLRGPFTGV